MTSSSCAPKDIVHLLCRCQLPGFILNRPAAFQCSPTSIMVRYKLLVKNSRTVAKNATRTFGISNNGYDGQLASFHSKCSGNQFFTYWKSTNEMKVFCMQTAAIHGHAFCYRCKDLLFLLQKLFGDCNCCGLLISGCMHFQFSQLILVNLAVDFEVNQWKCFHKQLYCHNAMLTVQFAVCFEI